MSSIVKQFRSFDNWVAIRGMYLRAGQRLAVTGFLAISAKR